MKGACKYMTIKRLEVEKKNKKLYSNITYEMKRNKITQLELAERIGMKDGSVNRSLKNLEKGKSILTETLFKICYGLDLEIIELFK